MHNSRFSQIMPPGSWYALFSKGNDDEVYAEPLIGWGINQNGDVVGLVKNAQQVTLISCLDADNFIGYEDQSDKIADDFFAMSDSVPIICDESGNGGDVAISAGKLVPNCPTKIDL